MYRVAVSNIRAQFDDTTWHAFHLTWEQDQPSAEVSKQLRKSPQWVYKAKFKVLARLRAELAELAEDEAMLQRPR